MKIGYACLTVGVSQTNLKTCMLKNASKEKLLELISHNLMVLSHMIDYNTQNHIKLFRISSDIIPFASSPVNTLFWWDIFRTQLRKLGEKIQNNTMRVSMHPGQYTVLNSTNPEVVEKAIRDLKYHAQFLDSLGLSPEHKIILHVGGVYQDKSKAMDRFIENYRALNFSIKKRLVIENDDKSYTIEDVLEIGHLLHIPVVFDNLHHAVNPPGTNTSAFEWIDACSKTWHRKDGDQKIHYSQQNPEKRPGSHSESISIQPFMDFYKQLNRKDIDIMLEVKDKNISAVNCIQAILKLDNL